MSLQESLKPADPDVMILPIQLPASSFPDAGLRYLYDFASSVAESVLSKVLRRFPAIRFSIRRLHVPIGRYFRSRRFLRLSKAFKISKDTTVLDIGGTAYYWDFFAVVPRVVIVNLQKPESPDSRFDWVIADARRLPFRDRTFDLAFANSIVEHIPGQENRAAFARETARVSRGYYVQTPYRWFPIEPHLYTPLIHYLPKSRQRPLLRNLTVWGILQRPTPEGCDDFLRDIDLLTTPQLRKLFPNATIWKERFCGLLKSIAAVQTRTHAG